MMYQIAYNGEFIYGEDEDKTVLDPSLEMELNAAGTLTITIPVENEAWSQFEVFRGEVVVYEGDDIIWFGRPLQIVRDWLNRKVVTCEGALAYFNDSLQVTKEYKQAQTPLYTDTTVYPGKTGFINDIIGLHNDQVESNRKIYIGEIDIDNELVYRYVDYETTADILQQMCLDTNGGYFILRKAVDETTGELRNYLDWRKEVPYSTDQPVQFGVNLLDLNQDLNGADICTVLLPTGENDLNISTVQVYSEDDPNHPPYHIADPEGDVLHSSGSVYMTHMQGYKRFGRVVKTKDFSAIADKNSLFQKAAEWLNEQNTDVTTIECSVADLHYLNEYSDYGKLRIGQKVQVGSAPHDLSKELPIYKVSMKLDSGAKTITLGTPPKRELTDIVKSNGGSTRGSSGATGSGSASDGGSGGSTYVPVTDVKVKMPGENNFATVVKKRIAQIDLSSIEGGSVADVKVNDTSVVDENHCANVDIPVLDVQIDGNSIVNNERIAYIDTKKPKLSFVFQRSEDPNYASEPPEYLEEFNVYPPEETTNVTIEEPGIYCCGLAGSGSNILNRDITCTNCTTIHKINYGSAIHAIFQCEQGSVVTFTLRGTSGLYACKFIAKLENVKPETISFRRKGHIVKNSGENYAQIRPKFYLYNESGTVEITTAYSNKACDTDRYLLIGIAVGSPYKPDGSTSYTSPDISYPVGYMQQNAEQYYGHNSTDSAIVFNSNKIDSRYSKANGVCCAFIQVDNVIDMDYTNASFDLFGDYIFYAEFYINTDNSDIVANPTNSSGIGSELHHLRVGSEVYKIPKISLERDTSSSPVNKIYLNNVGYDVSTVRANPAGSPSGYSAMDSIEVNGRIYRVDSVRPNLTDEPVADLKNLKINSTLYNIPRSVCVADYYTTQERIVGRWTNGKPLYQRTFSITGSGLVVSHSSWTDTSVSKGNISDIINCIGTAPNGTSRSLIATIAVSDVISLQTSENNDVTIKNFTIQYIKSTDEVGTGPTAGNLIYIPSLYSEQENEIGVWLDGKPLYQRTWTFESYITVSYNSWTNTDIDSTDIENIVGCIAIHEDGTCHSEVMADPTRESHTLVGLQTARNSNEARVKKLTLQYTKISDTAGSGLWSDASRVATDADIDQLQTNFQAGVDAIYDACVAKGSTPESHALSDVVDGIMAISTTPATYELATPAMTSNTTPSGVCSASEIYSSPSYEPWYAFSGTLGGDKQSWCTRSQTTGAWIQYEFPTAVMITKIATTNRNLSTPRACNMFKFQGSNDGITFVDIGDEYTITSSARSYRQEFYIPNQTAYTHYRIYVTAAYSSERVGFGQIELYKSTTVAGKVITQNGLYSAADDGFDGYNAVLVNVSKGEGDVIDFISEVGLAHIDEVSTITTLDLSNYVLTSEAGGV